MPNITQFSIDDVISRAPVIASIDAAWISDNPPHAYVCAQGFEERCDAMARLVASSNVRLQYVVVFSLRSNSEKDRENGRRMIDLLAPLSAYPPVIVEMDEPVAHRRIRGALGGDAFMDNENNHVLLDISVAANRLCLRALECFLRSNCQLTVAYTEAAVYHPEQNAFLVNEAVWMSDDSLGTEKGVEDISPSDDFPGEHLEAASNVVVLLPSFRHERSAAVISHVDPALLVEPSDDVIWILGRPHLDQDLWRRDAMRKINRIPEDAKVFEASTFDYREAWRVLEGIYRERWESSNITLSPIGSKMQALAVTLFCIRHSDVRVLLSIPQTYNAQQWSEGVRALWRISFGPAHEFLRDILQADTLRLEGIEL
jgi:hypothetical protein